MVMAILYAVYTEMTILYAVDSPFLHLLAYPRGAVALHTVDDDTSQQPQNASTTARETNVLIMLYCGRNAWALPHYVKRAIIRTRI